MLRKAIAAETYRPGDYLPPVRKLAEQSGVAYLTAVRALRRLDEEGLVQAEPRKGYRVLRARARPENGRMLFGFITSSDPHAPQLWNETHKALLTGFQCVSGRRGTAVLAMSSDARDPQAAVRAVLDAGIRGIALDSDNPALIAAFQQANVPIVLVDAFNNDITVDGVVQDNFRGGFLAGRHLVQHGHREVAWLGLSNDTIHSQERRGGALIALEAGGSRMAPKFDLRVPEEASGIPTDEAMQQARTLLSSPGRPHAILALWQSCAVALMAAAADLGLYLHKDFELVTWGIEENRQEVYSQRFRQGAIPPMICWSAVRMSELAIARLAASVETRDRSPMRINIPVRLFT
jgi:LacI family transcriptional regulator